MPGVFGAGHHGPQLQEAGHRPQQGRPGLQGEPAGDQHPPPASLTDYSPPLTGRDSVSPLLFIV